MNDGKIVLAGRFDPGSRVRLFDRARGQMRPEQGVAPVASVLADSGGTAVFTGLPVASTLGGDAGRYFANGARRGLPASLVVSAFKDDPAYGEYGGCPELLHPPVGVGA